jgi:hypothetical protein
LDHGAEQRKQGNEQAAGGHRQSQNPWPRAARTARVNLSSDRGRFQGAEQRRAEGRGRAPSEWGVSPKDLLAAQPATGAQSRAPVREASRQAERGVNHRPLCPMRGTAL